MVRTARPLRYLAVPAGATVDFEGAPQHLASLALAGDAEITDCALSADALTYAVPASGKTPCLTVGGDMDITETALTFTGMGMGAVGFSFYPGLQAVKTTPLGVLVYFAYGVLSLLPAIPELSEAWRWKSLQSAI